MLIDKTENKIEQKPFAVVSHFFDNGKAKTYIFTKKEFHQMPLPGKWKKYDTYIDYFDTRKECEEYIKTCHNKQR